MANSGHSSFLCKFRGNVEQTQGKQRVLLVSTGAYNPVHLLHVRLFYVAKKWLEKRLGVAVVGGVFSPSHDAFVREKNRRAPQRVIPARYRIAMCEISTINSSWLAVSRWEATRRASLDYPSVLRQLQSEVDTEFPGQDIRIMYLCGASRLLHVNPETLRQFECVCITRPGYTEALEKVIESEGLGDFVHVVDDDAVVSVEAAKYVIDVRTSSSKILDMLLQGEDVSSMTGPEVERFLLHHRIHTKIQRRSQWTAQDKATPTLEEELLSPTLLNKITRRRTRSAPAEKSHIANKCGPLKRNGTSVLSINSAFPSNRASYQFDRQINHERVSLRYNQGVMHGHSRTESIPEVSSLHKPKHHTSIERNRISSAQSMSNSRIRNGASMLLSMPRSYSTEPCIKKMT